MSLPAVIDAHHQLAPSGAVPSELDRLLSECGVAGAVLVQPEPSPDDARAALALAAEAKLAAGAVVGVDIESPGFPGVLDELADASMLRGICLDVSNRGDNHWLARDAVRSGLRETAGRGLSLDVVASPAQIPSVRALAEAIPDLRIALVHIGAPYIARGEREPWGVYMLNLAPLENVCLKLSGLLTLDAQPWSAARIKLFVEPVVRLFGYSRLMFGSDWPNPAPVAGYRQALEAVVEAASPMTDPQIEQILSATAADFYRLG